MFLLSRWVLLGGGLTVTLLGGREQNWEWAHLKGIMYTVPLDHNIRMVKSIEQFSLLLDMGMVANTINVIQKAAQTKGIEAVLHRDEIANWRKKHSLSTNRPTSSTAQEDLAVQ